MFKFRAHSFILYGLITYFIFFFLGPYKFTIYNFEGLLYCLFAFLLMFIGAWAFDRPMFKKDLMNTKYDIRLPKTAEVFLNLMVIVSLIAFSIYLIGIRNNPEISNYSFGAEDYRDLISINRSMLSKISEVLMYTGVAVYLIVSRLGQTNYKFTKLFAIFGFFLPAFAILAVGARSRVITTIGLYLIIYFMNKRELKRKPIIDIKKFYKYRFLFLIIFVILGYYTMNLFSTRGQYDATYQIVKYTGDTVLKDGFLRLFILTDGLVNPIYKALWYYTHSIPAFTWAYDRFVDVPSYFGAYLFYLPGYILRTIGLNFPEYLLIASKSPISGLYSTYLTGYFLDWGIYGTLIISFLTGALFGRISYSSKQKKLSYYILPIVLFMCWVAPIYYFLHMGWENVFLCLLFVYPLAKLLGLGRIRLEN